MWVQIPWATLELEELLHGSEPWPGLSVGRTRPLGRVAGHGQCIGYRAGAQAGAERTRWSHFLGHLAYSRSAGMGESWGKGGTGRTQDRATELPARETNSDRATRQGHLSRKRRGNEDT